MKFTQERDFSSHTIRAYAPGEISITLPAVLEAEKAQPVEVKSLTRSFIISPKQLVEDWLPGCVAELHEGHLEEILQLGPELVLLGTGPRQEFPDPALLAVVMQQQVGVEVMDTAAACRTYNILMHEGRNVVAGLMLPTTVATLAGC